jgi:hypothetical protein
MIATKLPIIMSLIEGFNPLFPLGIVGENELLHG